MSRPQKNIKLGIERLTNEESHLVKGLKLGLICNQSSVNHHLIHSADILSSNDEFSLSALFGPQHGIRGEVQDNMIETPHTTDLKTNLPIYSLYSETREPTSKMLDGLDALVFDMQDIGGRVYTFIYTMANCMRAAKKKGIKVIICDRPNPINGINIEGNLLNTEYMSFVGQFPIPMRHGMTVCELALLFNNLYGIGCDLSVVKMEGWRREMWFDDTDAPWVMPSPNMPTTETATVFPATVFLEGTMVSEGRGTTRPFEIIGAPYINPFELSENLNALGLNGVYFRECSFQPTFQKHSGEFCGGVQLHVTDRDSFKPVVTGVAIMKTLYDLYGENFKWKQPPYEYIYDKLPIDVIAGTDQIRKGIEDHKSISEITAVWHNDEMQFEKLRSEFLLY